MFNYRKEKAIFDAKWDKLRQQYLSLGMNEDAITELHEFDWELFCKRRNRINNSSDISLDEGLENGVNVEQLLFTNEHYIDIEKDFFSSKYEWIETVERINLVNNLKKLSTEDFELLTMHIVDGYSQPKIAHLKGCSSANISKKIVRIKKYLKQGCGKRSIS